jgi:hypothetical protein
VKKKERLTVVGAFSKEYQHSSKKSTLLERLMKTTAHSRKRLVDILLNLSKKKRIKGRPHNNGLI